MKDSIQSIERAFHIMQVVHQRADGIGIGELATETGLHTSTTSRIVSTLEHVGAIERRSGKLFIGEQIITLANQAPWTEQLISLATPCLRDLATETKEAVGLTQVEGDECIIFFQIPSNHILQIRDWTGERFPLHVTSTGKLYLAALNEDELEVWEQAPLPSYATNSKDSVAKLKAEFPQIQADGVAWTEDELEDGLTSVAAPIYNKHHEFIAAVYVSVPNYRLGNTDLLARLVKESADSISNSLQSTSRR